MTPLLNIVQRHLRKTGIPPTRFGREAAHDPRLVEDLRNGRAVGQKLAARVIAYIEAQS
jgi:RNA 3'-terminal phosphate cyclase